MLTPTGPPVIKKRLKWFKSSYLISFIKLKLVIFKNKKTISLLCTICNVLEDNYPRTVNCFYVLLRENPDKLQL